LATWKLREYSRASGKTMIRIAIIGASNNRAKYGNKAVRAYLKNGDEVFPIHPVQKEIEGLETYATVLDVPGEIDVASFYVSPQVGLRVIEECARKGIGEIILNPGAESDELLERAKELGIAASVSCSILMAGFSPREF
jgi:predicted CoA-binding protein